MTTSTATIADFLLARIEDDEATARYATTRGNPTDEDFGGWWLGHYDHANRHSPTRVLAECAAKRAIVGLHEPIDDGPDGWCQLCDGDGWPCGTMSALASVYADHADYRREWAS